MNTRMERESARLRPTPLLLRAAAPALFAWGLCAAIAWLSDSSAWALTTSALCVVGAGVSLWWTHATVGRPALRAREHARRTASVESDPASGVPGDVFRDISGAVDVLGDVIAGQRRALEQANVSLESLIDALADAAFITSYDGVVTHANAAALAFFDAKHRQVVGRSTRELFTRADLLSLHNAGWREGTRQVRCRLPTPRGERTYEVVVTPLPRTTASAPASITFLRDVSELADTQRVKTDFVANASHELRTPLSAIRAGIETLEQAKDDPAMSARVREMMGGHVARLEELVRDLLDLARVETPDLPVRVEPLRLEELTDSLRAEFEGVCAERGLTIDFSLDASLEGAPTDPRLLRLILRNLIENATKFCEAASTVRVVGGLTREAGGGAAIRCEVHDKGLGIPLNQQSRVFERFYQVDQSRSGAVQGGGQRRGTGLGLAIVRHAVRAMGGRVGLESVWKQGTMVWFEAPAPPRQPSPENGSGGGSDL